jgi:hypothetical protein
MSFKSRFKLEFDIETNSENMEEILYIITDNIKNELEQRIKDKTEITCNAKIEKIEVDKYADLETGAETVSHH